MQRVKYVVVITLALFAVFAISGQNAGTAANQGVGQAGNSAAQQPVLRVLTRKPGEKLRQDFVTVQIELTNEAASAAGMPNFKLRLDSRDAVTTNATEYTFTGLTPGTQ